MFIDKEILKWIIVIGTAPIWIPFMKALWEELNLAMREDGGLVGPEPGPIKRREIREQIAREEPRLVSETLAHYKARRSGPRAQAEHASPAHGAGPQAGAVRREGPRPSRRGFR